MCRAVPCLLRALRSVLRDRAQRCRAALYLRLREVFVFVSDVFSILPVRINLSAPMFTVGIFEARSCTANWPSRAEVAFSQFNRRRARCRQYTSRRRRRRVPDDDVVVEQTRARATSNAHCAHTHIHDISQRCSCSRVLGACVCGERTSARTREINVNWIRVASHWASRVLDFIPFTS